MDDHLKHFSHEHPLMFKEEAPLKNEASGQPVLCSACGEPVLGPNYSCNQCSNEFILHKPCAQLSREIQHPMHREHPLTILTRNSRPYIAYICDICRARSSGDSYSCSKCYFDLDFKCAANIDCIEHFSHKHLLLFTEIEKRPTPISCIGCLEEVLGQAYTCKRFAQDRSCSEAFLHKSCAELPREFKHPLYRQHSLSLNRIETRDHHYCDACDQDCSRRFNYSCFLCDFNLDLKCASEKGFKHFIHEHPLMIKKQEDRRRGSDPLVICDACQVPLIGPSYTCIHAYRRHKCRFNLHKSCAELPREIQHPVHLQHPLVLVNTIQDIKVRCSCNACNQPCRYRYSCSICEFNLDLKCASTWQNIIENDSHQHQFIVPRKELAELNCDVCGEYWSGIIFYICSICQFLVHEECASFPNYTKIPGHHHRLKLTWFLEDIYPKDQVCKICSTNIDTCRTVYYCRECCEYAAHTTCMAVEYFQKEENRDRSLNIENDDYESDDDAGEIKHFSHQHLLVAKDYLQEVKNDRKLTCHGCIRPITEDYYSCSKQEEEPCHFYLHKICARLPEKLLLPLLHQHQFTLLPRAPSIDGVFQCYMCGIFHHGFVYSCEQCASLTGENLFYIDQGWNQD